MRDTRRLEVREHKRWFLGTPTGVCAMVNERRASVDGARVGKSILAGAFWARAREFTWRFRRAGGTTHASGAAGLDGERIHGERLEAEAAASVDHDFDGVSAKFRKRSVPAS